MGRLPRVHVRQSQLLFRLTKLTLNRFAACVALTLLASLHHYAYAAHYGNDPLGQVYTHDGGGYVYDVNQNQTFQYVKAPGSATPVGAYAAFPGLEIEYRLDGSGNLTRQVLRRHIGNQRQTVIGPNDDAIVESDALGNAAMVRHSASTAYANYTPFGQMIASRTNGFSNEWYGYKGGRIDLTGTGFYRFGARDYDPRTGFWNSRDPIRYRPTMAFANPYAAFGENSIANDDPSGLQSIPGNAIEHPMPIPPADVAAAVRQFCQASPSECINGIPNSGARAAYYTRYGRLPAITPLAGQNGRLQPGSGVTPIPAPSHLEALPSRPEIGMAAGATLAAEGTGAAILRFGPRALPYLNAARAAAARQWAATFFSAGSTAAGGGPTGPMPNYNSAAPTNGVARSRPGLPSSIGGGGGGDGGSGLCILNLGCGGEPRISELSGRYPRARIVLADPDVNAMTMGIEAYRAENGGMPSNVEHIFTSGQFLPSGVFDRVYIENVHPNYQAAATDAARLLRPGGQAFITYDTAFDTPSLIFSRFTAEITLRAAGFQTQTISYDEAVHMLPFDPATSTLYQFHEGLEIRAPAAR